MGIGIYLAMRMKSQIPDSPKLEVRRNPNFYKDENAFMTLFNLIMKKE